MFATNHKHAPGSANRKLAFQLWVNHLFQVLAVLMKNDKYNCDKMLKKTA